MDIRDELHEALDDEQFSSSMLLARAMSGLDLPRLRQNQRWAPLIACVLAVALVLTFVVVRATQDGLTILGRTAVLPVLSTVTGPTSYQFVSAQVGWLSVTRWTNSSTAVVFKTTDGGRTWRRQLVLSGEFSPPSPHMQFFGDADGVVVGQNGNVPTVWLTTDGGMNWQAHPLPWDGQQVFVAGYFLDAQHGWVLTTRFGGSGTVSGPAFVYQTADGGKSWNRLKAPDSESGIAWSGITFATSSTGFVMASAGQPGQSWNAALPLFATHDGGRTWTRLMLRAPGTGEFFEEVVSFSGSAGILIVNNGVGPCFASAPRGSCASIAPAGRYLYTTADAGLTWSDPRSIANGYLDLVDPKRWILITTNRLSVSTDGGRTWSTPRPIGVPQGWFVTQALFLDGRQGWLLLGSDVAPADGPFRRTALVYTNDGGSSWKAVPLPRPE